MKLFCPSCGTALEFRYDDSFVRVCPACRSAIVRGDRGIDSFGQHADLAPTGSGLALSDRGRFQGTGFELAGRALYRHAKGGSWEEWYLKFDDGRWGWLAQAHGDWMLTFATAVSRALPPFEQLSPGMEIALGEAAPSTLTIGECSVASLIGAEGELPFAFTPGAASRFADLSDGGSRFATLDYGEPGSSDPPAIYLGRRVSFLDLGLSPRVPDAGSAPAHTGRRLGCPNCGGSIELRVPDRSLSVACPYCASLLDCEGDLKILAKLSERPEPSPIELGSKGRFDGVSYVVTGRLRREAEYGGDDTFGWDEFLLYAPEVGYRWLACARGHYSFITPLPVGSVRPSTSDGVRYEGTHFSLYDVARAKVRGVWGEFYWKVSVGETVYCRDYVAPPAMLSSEQDSEELHWSLGIYQTPEQIRQAFGLSKMKDTRSGVAGNQPFPHPYAGHVAALLAAAFVACTVLRALIADDRVVYTSTFNLGPSTRAVAGEGEPPPAQPSYVFFTPEFQLSESKNLSIDMQTPLHNSWVYAIVDLVHEQTGERRTFGTEISYYSGVDGGERWTEGSDHATHTIGAGQPGAHLIRLEVQTPHEVNSTFRMTVTEGVLPVSHFFIVLLVLAAPGLLLLLYRWMFERARWSESDHAPALFRGGSDD